MGLKRKQLPMLEDGGGGGGPSAKAARLNRTFSMDETVAASIDDRSMTVRQGSRSERGQGRRAADQGRVGAGAGGDMATGVGEKEWDVENSLLGYRVRVASSMPHHCTDWRTRFWYC